MREAKHVLYNVIIDKECDIMADKVCFRKTYIMFQIISEMKPVSWMKKMQKLQSMFGDSRTLVDLLRFVSTETLLL